MRTLSAFLFICIIFLFSLNISTEITKKYEEQYKEDIKFIFKDIKWDIKSNIDSQNASITSSEGKLLSYKNHFILSNLKLNLKESSNRMLNLTTEEAIYKRKEGSLASKEFSIFEVEDLSIQSNGFSLENMMDNLKLKFFQSKVFEKERNLFNLIGQANTIEYRHSEDLIVFKGNAEFKLDNFTLNAKEIYYDLKRKEIVKSVESKMINTSK